MLRLFLTFFKIGAVSFGGGYAMIPLVTEEAILTFGMTETEVLNFIAVSESTPGPIAINMATFIGASEYGFFGALLATLGVILPAFVIMLLVASLITGLLQFAWVKAFLGGVRPVVIGLILGTGLTMLLTVIFSLKTVYGGVGFDYRALIIFCVVAITSIVYKRISKKAISPIFLIIISALLGMLLYGLLA